MVNLKATVIHSESNGMPHAPVCRIHTCAQWRIRFIDQLSGIAVSITNLCDSRDNPASKIQAISYSVVGQEGAQPPSWLVVVMSAIVCKASGICCCSNDAIVLSHLHQLAAGLAAICSNCCGCLNPHPVCHEDGMLGTLSVSANHGSEAYVLGLPQFTLDVSPLMKGHLALFDSAGPHDTSPRVCL